MALNYRNEVLLMIHYANSQYYLKTFVLGYLQNAALKSPRRSFQVFKIQTTGPKRLKYGLNMVSMINIIPKCLYEGPQIWIIGQ